MKLHQTHQHAGSLRLPPRGSGVMLLTIEAIRVTRVCSVARQCHAAKLADLAQTFVGHDSWATRGQRILGTGCPFGEVSVSVALRLSLTCSTITICAEHNSLLIPVPLTRSYRNYWLHFRLDRAPSRVFVFSSVGGLLLLRQARPGLCAKTSGPNARSGQSQWGLPATQRRVESVWRRPFIHQASLPFADCTSKAPDYACRTCPKLRLTIRASLLVASETLFSSLKTCRPPSVHSLTTPHVNRYHTRSLSSPRPQTSSPPTHHTSSPR